MSTLKHQMGGCLSVGLTALADTLGIAAIVGRVRRQHPAIELEFIDMRPQQIVVALHQGTLDLGLLTEEWGDSELLSLAGGYIETIAADAGLAMPPIVHRGTSLTLGIGPCPRIGRHR